MSENKMAQFSLVQGMMFSTPRLVRMLVITDQLCVTWTPRFFTKRELRINLFGTGCGVFDADAIWYGKRLATMRRAVSMRGLGKFTFYRFGERQEQS